MISFNDITQRLFARGVTFSIEDYLFVWNIVIGEDIRVAYALAYDAAAYKKVLGTEEEEDYLDGLQHSASEMFMRESVDILKKELQTAFDVEVQNRSMNLENYHFTGGQLAQILQNLLQNKIEDLDSASTKDVVSLIKLLADQFGIGGDTGFEKHFIQVFPKFNALCTNCNHEFQVAEGLGATCPHCGAKYIWSNEENRFYPQPSKL